MNGYDYFEITSIYTELTEHPKIVIRSRERCSFQTPEGLEAVVRAAAIAHLSKRKYLNM